MAIREWIVEMSHMNVLKKLTGWTALTALVAVMIVASGCITPGESKPPLPPPPAPPTTETFNVGELVLVNFSGVEMPPTQHEERIKADGTVTLSLIGSVPAVGKTPGQLQHEIRERYLVFYKPSLNVTVKWQERFFYVGGQVKSSGRLPWTEGMTLVKAIQTAGGFNEDYAKTTKVRVTRLNGKTFIVNCDKATVNSEFDVPIYPGDTINVPKRW